MSAFPIFLDLAGRTCLVVGGGEIAARKIRLLRKANAEITVIAPTACAEIAELAEACELVLKRRKFELADAAGNALVISATGRVNVDHQVARAAQAAGVPVNVVDMPKLSTFVMPAIVDRDPVIVAIGSGGASPVLVRRIRAQIERLLPAGIGRLARFARAFRQAVAATLPDGDDRRRFWERFFDGPIADAVLSGNETTAREHMLALVNLPDDAARGDGIVHIVGAGPGDPDLLTLRALRLMQNCDVVVYDRLIGPDLLDYVRRDAERVYVGKAKANHSLSQDEINGLLVRHARAGKRVLRLKGGDPFVFGRGGEEVDELRRQDIPVEVVPGITAAAGAAAVTRIPLTHRDHASAVTFVTGHGKDGDPDVDWAGLARSDQTIVIYMGLSNAGTIAARLTAHGRDGGTPAAVIENATLPNQRLVTGRLAGLGDLVADNAIEGPALLVIGDVVRFANTAFASTLPRARAS